MFSLRSNSVAKKTSLESSYEQTVNGDLVCSAKAVTRKRVCFDTCFRSGSETPNQRQECYRTCMGNN